MKSDQIQAFEVIRKAEDMGLSPLRGYISKKLRNADPGRRRINKTRYCLAQGNRYYEIDIYPFWSDKAILEIELRDEDEEVRLPQEIRVLKEVTNDPEYKNAALARLPQYL